MASSAGTAPLLECSICLDRFTDPRMLPCQHTFCLQCVKNLVGDDEATVVTCAQCRARHTLPSGRVQALPGNVLLNNLLSLPVESPTRPTASTPDSECADCKEKGPVSLCNHCQERVCVECRVQHATLSRDVQQTLNQLRESLSPPGGSTERVEASLRAVKIERERMNEAVQEQADSLLQALETRQTQLDAIFQTLVGVHEDLLQPAGRKPFLENFSRQAVRSKKTKSLQQLKESLEEVKTLASLAHRSEVGVKFSSVPLEMDFENWGHVQFGDSAVYVVSGIKTMSLTDATSGPDASAAGAEGPPVPRSHPRQATVGGVSRNVTAAPRSDVAQSNRQSRPTRSMHPQPRNVNYQGKWRATALVIGPNLGLGNGQTYLKRPSHCVHNAHTEELIVCDKENDRVLAMKTDGTDVRPFYTTNEPQNIAMSDDGQDVFLQTNGPAKIHLISISGSHIKTIESFSDGAFDTIWSVFYHNQQVAVLHEKKRRSVVLFNTSLEQTRSFRVDAVRAPCAMTVDSDGNFYIADYETGAVHVYTWGGQHTRSFGAVSGWKHCYGICVDGDGVVCVSRFGQHRVDVYDREGRRVTTFGRKGTSPGEFHGPRGLHLLPDGRMVVVDRHNDRLQII